MSGLWTPGGEDDGRIIAPDGTATERPPADPTEEELEAFAAEMRRQILETPVEIVARAQAAYFGQVAAVHLTVDRPDFGAAAMAIDAMAALVDGLNGRIANEDLLRDQLAQLRLMFVEVRQAADGSDGSEGSEDG
ncbi:MAG TPA: hypothetical protein VGA13_04800 [Acidimicrobiales bacterium]